jgi:hypothetical protein
VFFAFGTTLGWRNVWGIIAHVDSSFQLFGQAQGRLQSSPGYVYCRLSL